MREKIYENISAEVSVSENGAVQLNIYGSLSKYPFLVLPDIEAVKRMKEFLVRVIEQEDKKR